jgi:Protein of unknown function (DUF3142)
MPVGTVFRTAVQFRPAPPFFFIVSRRLLLAGCLALSLGTAHDATFARSSSRSIVLWAWERPEDFRAARPTTIAFLERTLIIRAHGVDSLKRRQPLRIPPRSPLISVVRIEGRGVIDDRLVSKIAMEVVDSAGVPGVSMVQIDFDATRSQRAAYQQLLREVRSRLPKDLRLSVTALASWCNDDPWIDPQSVDEIVPMIFRMGPDARRIDTRLREDRRWPVSSCNSAVGISLDEGWRALPPVQRVYVFNPRAWSADDVSRTLRLLSY